jgi:hypothetical protein
MLKINLDPDRAHRIDDELLGVALMSVDLDLFHLRLPCFLCGESTNDSNLRFWT